MQQQSFEASAPLAGTSSIGFKPIPGGDQQMPPSYDQATYATQAQPLQPPVVIIQHQAAVPVGPDPTYLTCPFCHVAKRTTVVYEPASKTHLMAALLCILGFWCCVCVPYCMTSCMNANHYCGSCSRFVGAYNN